MVRGEGEKLEKKEGGEERAGKKKERKRERKVRIVPYRGLIQVLSTISTFPSFLLQHLTVPYPYRTTTEAYPMPRQINKQINKRQSRGGEKKRYLKNKLHDTRYRCLLSYCACFKAIAILLVHPSPIELSKKAGYNAVQYGIRTMVGMRWRCKSNYSPSILCTKCRV